MRDEVTHCVWYRGFVEEVSDAEYAVGFSEDIDGAEGHVVDGLPD